MTSIFDVTKMLEKNSIYFTLSKTLPDAVRVTASIVGERIEIEVYEDGHVEVSRFKGHEDIEGGIDLLSTIIQQNRRF